MTGLSKKLARRDKIVQAAGKLFAYQGYHGTSTRQIAHLANIAENTLFRHFEDKESLFWATLSSYFGPLDIERSLLAKIAHGEPPEVVLPKILELFADTVSYRPELLRLTLVAFVEMHPKGEAFIQARLSPALAAINRYLEMNIKRGKLRDLDSTMLTAALTMTSLTIAEVSRLIDKDKPILNYQEKNLAQAKFWLATLMPRIPANEPASKAIGGENRG